MSESPRFLRRNYSATTDRSDVSLGSQLLRKFSAQAMSMEVDTVRSISGRLGGRLASSPSLALSVDPPMEGTSLLFPNSPMLSRKFSSLNDFEFAVTNAPTSNNDSPSLIEWIFPALACASSYALYNVSCLCYNVL